MRVTGQWGQCLSRKAGRGQELLGSWCGCLGAKDLEYRAGSVDKQDWVDVGVKECGVTVASGAVGQKRGRWAMRALVSSTSRWRV